MKMQADCGQLRAVTPPAVCASLFWALCAASTYSATIAAAAPPAGPASTVSDAPVVAPAPAAAEPVELPAAEGAWLVEVTKSGGLAGGYTIQAINSIGEGSTSSRRSDSVRRMIPRNLLADVETQVRAAAQFQTWTGTNANPSCNDCQRIGIVLLLRQAGGAISTRSVDWTLYPAKSPSNAGALLVAVASALSGAPAVR